MEGRVRRPRKVQPVDFYLVIDFEATCEKDSRDSGFTKDYPNEIIEFPVVVLNATTGEIEKDKSFHYYVKPTQNPHLTTFCTELTGIKQEQVDQGIYLADALLLFEKWLEEHNFVGLKFGPKNLHPGKTFAILTDGPWDLRNFLYLECLRKGIDCDKDYFKRWVNIRWLFGEFYKSRRRNISSMLKQLGMTFEGNPHSGIDDAFNIARIASQMISDGCVLYINDSLQNPVDGNRDFAYRPYTGLQNPSAKGRR
eukprot:TRINITY_DN645_c0_g1_i1.p1 TRINITY_DN645_c0_g1~~TRINITY_DN645_c0_g1_i1.p1  ORF type:complete len:253 (+),score=40.22 TRINITY_DN645_c0_g1_i1:36-794(+)